MEKYLAQRPPTPNPSPEGEGIFPASRLPREPTPSTSANSFGDQGDEKGSRCVSLIPHLCNPQAAVVSPLRRINQNRSQTLQGG